MCVRFFSSTYYYYFSHLSHFHIIVNSVLTFESLREQYYKKEYVRQQKFK